MSLAFDAGLSGTRLKNENELMIKNRVKYMCLIVVHYHRVKLTKIKDYVVKL
jgi:hypothetical protein